MTLYQTSPRRSSCAEIHGSNGALDSVPADFDPASYPIISRHYFGLKPLCLVGEVGDDLGTDLRFRRQVEHLHQLGVRAVGELLHEVAAGKNLDRALEAYESLTPDLLTALRGDRFPPLPIHAVSS